ncbi:cyclin-I-like [Hydractinia symbiolongicarpus]|uniref:cyclin-I-like n=1 Tax=Hydractinia symbiolongicarpus TaxID=13093 RepID=UPI00254E9CE8|nr:cyclin-I-like [Hydractinia symbiolongicarpus]
MLDKLCRDPSHLERQLKVKLAEEKDLKIFDWLKLNNIQDAEEWKENVRWLIKLNQECGFQCETFALSVHILDSFLGFVKVRGKYLKCATLSAYYIAVKVMEEEEFIPSLTSFINITGNQFTCNDITRMERIILQKTNWDLNHVTLFTFLEIFFSYTCAQHFKTLFGSDSLAYSIYRNLANQAQHCISTVSLLQYKGSLKALALLSCTLEKITSRWFLYIEQVSRLAKIDVQELLECRDVIKTVVFGIHKKPRAPKLKKFAKRHSVLAQRRSPLSPIVENPFENDVMRHCQSLLLGNRKTTLSSIGSPIESKKPAESDLFNEELKRLRQISLDEMQMPSPVKRRRLTSCGVECKFKQDVCTLLTSPIKAMPV